MVHTVNGAAVCGDKLVELMAYIAGAQVAYIVGGVRQLHGALIHSQQQVGLVVQAVLVCIHLMTGVNVQFALQLQHTRIAVNERRGGVAVGNLAITYPVPVLGVFDHSYHLFGVALCGIGLAEYQVIVVLSGKVAAKQGQFIGESFGGL